MFLVEKNLIKVSCVRPVETFSTFLYKLSFSEIKFFRKFPQKFSLDLDTILLEHCSNFSYSLPKILREFSHFCRISTYFL